jgi:hypothetical protein
MITIQTEVLWEGPKSFFETFEKWLSNSKLANSAPFTLQATDSGMLQLFPSEEAFQKTAEIRRKQIQQNKEYFFGKKRMNLVDKFLAERQLIPKIIPKEGIRIRYSIINYTFQSEKDFYEIIYYKLVDSSIKFEFIDGYKKFDLVFPNKSSLLNYFSILFDPLIEKKNNQLN